MPPDVRKAFGLPARFVLLILGYAQFVGAKPRIHFELERKRAALPHIRWQSHAGVLAEGNADQSIESTTLPKLSFDSILS